jgi:hypothetical protein
MESYDKRGLGGRESLSLFNTRMGRITFVSCGVMHRVKAISDTEIDQNLQEYLFNRFVEQV